MHFGRMTALFYQLVRIAQKVDFGQCDRGQTIEEIKKRATVIPLHQTSRCFCLKFVKDRPLLFTGPS